MINSIFIPIFANYFIKRNLYTKGGLADDIFLLGITNAFMAPILKIFNISYFIGKIVAWWKRRPSILWYI